MDKISKKNIVISAINITNVGPFAILKECLDYMSQNLANEYNIIALIHKKSLFNINNIKYYEFPDAKKSWFKRLFYEYFYFKGFSRRLKPYLWLSLHDVTPCVEADIRAVYCHNPAPFYKLSFWEFKIDPIFALFHFFYNYAYAINIKKNDMVIVQQDWLRNIFKKRFKLNNVVVARPNIECLIPSHFESTFATLSAGSGCLPDGRQEEILTENGSFASLRMTNNVISQQALKKRDGIIRFFYPSFPRVFKNFETVCEAARILSDKGKNNFELYITIDGNENKYARYIFSRYKDVKQIKFIGVQPREKIFEYYGKVDCLIFASKLETWGLPITEFKSFDKPILLADTEYARETIGDYDKVRFFNPQESEQLAGFMNALVENRLVLEKTKMDMVEEPFALNWGKLFDILLKNKKNVYTDSVNSCV